MEDSGSDRELEVEKKDTEILRRLRMQDGGPVSRGGTSRGGRRETSREEQDLQRALALSLRYLQGTDIRERAAEAAERRAQQSGRGPEGAPREGRSAVPAGASAVPMSANVVHNLKKFVGAYPQGIRGDEWTGIARALLYGTSLSVNEQHDPVQAFEEIFANLADPICHGVLIHTVAHDLIVERKWLPQDNGDVLGDYSSPTSTREVTVHLHEGLVPIANNIWHTELLVETDVTEQRDFADSDASELREEKTRLNSLIGEKARGASVDARVTIFETLSRSGFGDFILVYVTCSDPETCKDYEGNPVENFEVEKKEYDCRAALFHIGDTTRYGHWTANIRTMTGWMSVNDERVNKATEWCGYRVPGERRKRKPRMLLYARKCVKDIPLVRGLRNIHSSCYLNACMQLTYVICAHLEGYGGYPFNT